MEGFLKASGLCRCHRAKAPTAAGKEKNDSDFARARSLVTEALLMVSTQSARQYSSKMMQINIPDFI
jgi:hypothetical protein